MKEWIKENWWKIFLFVLIFAFGIPLFVNYLHKIPAPVEFLRVTWKAEDTLLFYGGIISACIAVYGVFLTIQFSQRNYKEDVRNRVLPIFSINVLNVKNRANWNYEHEMNTNKRDIQYGYTEYEFRDYYITVKDGRIGLRETWTEKQKELLDSGGVTKVSNGAKIKEENYLCLPVVAKNVGNGPALNVRCGFNKENTSRKKRKYTYPIPATVGEKVSIHVFFENAAENSCDLGNYALEILYQDILGNNYLQKLDVELKYDFERDDTICASSGGEQCLYSVKMFTEADNDSQK